MSASRLGVTVSTLFLILGVNIMVGTAIASADGGTGSEPIDPAFANPWITNAELASLQELNKTLQDYALAVPCPRRNVNNS